MIFAICAQQLEGLAVVALVAEPVEALVAKPVVGQGDKPATTRSKQPRRFLRAAEERPAH